MFPEYSARERVADGCVHAVGVTASLAATGTLLVVAAHMLPAASVASLAVYGVGLVAMFSFSAAYNLVTRPGLKAVLRRFDHAAIFVMIAGTYTPLALIAMGGAWGFGLFAAVWAIALIGVALNLFAPHLFRRVSIGLYLAQGWVALAALDPLVAQVSPHVLALIGIGGALYTVGVLFHVWDRLPYNNAIWHVFVLVAAAVHYAAILEATALI
ncbi:MAG: PAQR family membrane homeostasis protein TrhA [Methyloligellaceae bacterium]